MTGYETSLLEFTTGTDNLWCSWCKEMVEVTNRDNAPILMLDCGHRTTRENSLNSQQTHELHMDIGFPKIQCGWFSVMDKDYPSPNEMRHKIKMYPELVGKIRKYLGKGEWKPE